MTESQRIKISTSALANLFGVTGKTISLWVKDGLPKISTGIFDLKEAFDWWNEKINADDATPENQAAKDRYWIAKADGEEMKVAKLKGELASVPEFERQEAHRMTGLRGSLLAMTNRLASVLEGKTQLEIREAIKAEVYSILEHFHTQKKYGGYAGAEEFELEADEEEEVEIKAAKPKKRKAAKKKPAKKAKK